MRVPSRDVRPCVRHATACAPLKGFEHPSGQTRVLRMLADFPRATRVRSAVFKDHRNFHKQRRGRLSKPVIVRYGKFQRAVIARQPSGSTFHRRLRHPMRVRGHDIACQAHTTPRPRKKRKIWPAAVDFTDRFASVLPSSRDRGDRNSSLRWQGCGAADLPTTSCWRSCGLAQANLGKAARAASTARIDAGSSPRAYWPMNVPGFEGWIFGACIEYRRPIGPRSGCENCPWSFRISSGCKCLPVDRDAPNRFGVVKDHEAHPPHRVGPRKCTVEKLVADPLGQSKTGKYR